MAQKNELTKYEELVEANPEVAKVITREMADIMFANNEHTVNALDETWTKNFHANIPLFKKHGSFLGSFHGFGTNKAVIAVGAGPSFNNNKAVLKDIYEWNLQFPVDQQPFIIVATNKQLKPLLELGIYPHFTILVDAGDALLPQFQLSKKQTKDMFLVTGLHTSPKISQQWHDHGGQIRFWAIGEDDKKKILEKKCGKNLDHIFIQQGGNVLNTLWIISNSIMNSRFFITVGNDLAFKYSPDKAEREKSFYADGDYRLNILNKRDEAQDNLAWMGFENFRESSIAPGHWMFDAKVMGTSRLLWIYKTWVEVQVALWAEQLNFAYVNASESGILGMLAHEPKGDALFEKDNWFLMDELYRKHWYTMSLKDAFKMFIEMRMLWARKEILGDAVAAAGSPLVMAGASGAGLIQ